MLGQRVRRLRQAAGWSQDQLAAQAGVSRQLVGSVEAGRHLPRVDAALRLARALGVSVESLLAPEADRVIGVMDVPPPPDGRVRLGRVGDRWVWAPPPAVGDAWGLADGLLRDGEVVVMPGARPGVVAVGCDPAIGLAASLLTVRGDAPVLAVPASTAAAARALAQGRAHAAVVHGREGDLPEPDVPVVRWHLARWRVGLGGARVLRPGWWRDALAGRIRVVQREAGAGSQAAFERAVAAAGVASTPAGPCVGGHLEAARFAAVEGCAGVTIEPAARAADLAFHPLEVHQTQVWVAAQWAHEPGVHRLGETLASSAFQRRLAAVGGYDLAGCGVAA